MLITGPSGGGKSTLLRLLVRLEEYDSGLFLFKDKPLKELSPLQLRTKIVLLQQTPVIIAGSVRDNLLLPFTFSVNQQLAKPDDEQLRKQLNRVLLNDIALDSVATGLSVGQQQRICLVRSLLLQPEVLLLDEPVSALDPESKRVVEAMIEKLNGQGITIIMVSHADCMPQRMPIRRLELRDGKLITSQAAQMEGRHAK